MDASEASAGKKKEKRQWKKIDPGQILDIQSYEDVRKGDGKGKGKNEKGKGRGKGEDGEGKGKGKGGGKNYNRPETSGDASPSAEASPPVEATPAQTAVEGGEQRPPFQPSKGGGKGGGKARGKGFKGDDGKGGKGKGGKGKGFQPQGGGLNQGASPAEGSPTPSPAPGPAEEPRPAPPPQAPNSGNSFPGMPGGFMQQPMAGCMACPMPFFDMSQVSMYPGYMGGCMPYPMPYNVNPEMMPCMGGAAPNSEQRTEQINKAKTQIEYYFSEENLIKDVFLRQNIMDTQGWVPLNRLLEFPQLAKTCRTDMSILIDAIMQSTSLELKADASAVRLKGTWSRWVLQRNS